MRVLTTVSVQLSDGAAEHIVERRLRLWLVWLPNIISVVGGAELNLNTWFIRRVVSLAAGKTKPVIIKRIRQFCMDCKLSQ